MRPCSLLPVLAVLASCSYAPLSTACGGAGVAPCRTLADVDIVDRNTGEHLPVYWHDGQRWIAGTPGHRYSVTLHNRTSGRILTVVAVDGVNAISGATADTNQGGYVLGAWQAFDVLGWRKSLDHVADFVFTSVPDSYAARTGRPDNVGVIGVAVFSEAVPVAPPPVGLSRREDSNAPPQARRWTARRDRPVRRPCRRLRPSRWIRRARRRRCRRTGWRSASGSARAMARSKRRWSRIRISSRRRRRPSNS
jgi:hypothetical protein